MFFYKKRDPEAYGTALAHLIEETKHGRMFGEWNDYGRLLRYEDEYDCCELKQKNAENG